MRKIVMMVAVALAVAGCSSTDDGGKAAPDTASSSTTTTEPAGNPCIQATRAAASGEEFDVGDCSSIATFIAGYPSGDGVPLMEAATSACDEGDESACGLAEELQRIDDLAEGRAARWRVRIIGVLPCEEVASDFDTGQAVSVDAGGETSVGRLNAGRPAAGYYGSPACARDATVLDVPTADIYTVTLEGRHGTTFTVTEDEVAASHHQVTVYYSTVGGQITARPPEFD